MDSTHTIVQTPISASDSHESSRDDLFRLFKQVREYSNTLCKPLRTEDFCIQSAEYVSPTRWHLAHTSWFFEQFVLREYKENYRPLDPEYAYLFNSYYIQAGPVYARPKRGHISRPTVEQIFEYRSYVDKQVIDLISDVNEKRLGEIAGLITLGCHHEQQHQELILTDIKHVFSQNPLFPRYAVNKELRKSSVPPIRWISFDEGIHEMGYTGSGFSYDNENPRHRVFLEPFKIASRLITNGEYLEFISDRGYERAELWLSLAWDTVQKQSWRAPLYWFKKNDEWWNFTLQGLRPVDLDEPVCHISYFEADAFARWADARLPYEAEWERAAGELPVSGNFVEDDFYHTTPLYKTTDETTLRQMYGDVWEWTLSHYSPYPGYRPPKGAIGEYNGKFMCNQFVLRGGSCATSRTHIRKTYRNFFQPETQWQFSGIRLAKTS
jgi:ergothioneine biosynthesis protein EgtB